MHARLDIFWANCIAGDHGPRTSKFGCRAGHSCGGAAEHSGSPLPPPKRRLPCVGRIRRARRPDGDRCHRAHQEHRTRHGRGLFGPARVKRRTAELVMMGARWCAYRTALFLVLSPGIADAFLGVPLAVSDVDMGRGFAPESQGHTDRSPRCETRLPPGQFRRRRTRSLPDVGAATRIAWACMAVPGAQTRTIRTPNLREHCRAVAADPIMRPDRPDSPSGTNPTRCRVSAPTRRSPPG